MSILISSLSDGVRKGKGIDVYSYIVFHTNRNWDGISNQSQKLKCYGQKVIKEYSSFYFRFIMKLHFTIWFSL